MPTTDTPGEAFDLPDLEKLGVKVGTKAAGALPSAIGIATNDAEHGGDPRLKGVLEKIVAILYDLKNADNLPETNRKENLKEATDKLVEYCTLGVGNPAEDWKMDYRAQQELEQVRILLEEILSKTFPGEVGLPEKWIKRFRARAWDAVSSPVESFKKSVGNAPPIVRGVRKQKRSSDRERIEKVLEDVLNAQQGGYTKLNRRQLIAGGVGGVAATLITQLGLSWLFPDEETPRELFKQFTVTHMGGRKVKFTIPSGYTVNHSLMVYIAKQGVTEGHLANIGPDGTFEVPAAGQWNFSFKYRDSKGEEKFVDEWRMVTVR